MGLGAGRVDLDGSECRCLRRRHRLAGRQVTELLESPQGQAGGQPAPRRPGEWVQLDRLLEVLGGYPKTVRVRLLAKYRPLMYRVYASRFSVTGFTSAADPDTGSGSSRTIACASSSCKAKTSSMVRS